MSESVLQDTEFTNTRALERKIRVAYIINSLRDGGAERQLLELLRHHDRNQFDLSLILMDGHSAKRVSKLVDDVFVMNVPVDGNANWFPRTLCYVNAIRRTSSYLRQWRPDILHALLPGPCILGGMAAIFADVPVVVRSPRSMLGLYRPRTRIGAWLDEIFLRSATFSIGNSQAVSRELIEVAKCSPEKCGTIYNGVDLDRFRPDLTRAWRNSVGWNESHIVFGLVGNFSLAKQHCDFVEAAGLIAKNHQQARFILIGADHGMKRSVIEQINSSGLASKFHTAEATPDPQYVFAALDVYVCTSATEGFSNVILEAMACGKPVIATDTGGNPEAVEHNVTGFLVPVGSPSSVADAAELLLRDPNLRQYMGACGRQRVEERFSLQATTEATERLYIQLLQAA